MTLRVTCGIGLFVWMLSGTLEAQVGSMTGVWTTSFNHPTSGGFPSTFEAIDLAVIPAVTSNVNDVVIAWDNQDHPLGFPGPWPQRFTVGSPEGGAASFTNYTVTIPLGPAPQLEFHGDLFCSGHCWLPDGRLFVAGGNTQYASGTAPYLGSKFAGIWDPAAPRVAPDFGWDFSLVRNNKPMRLLRWYPTVTLISRNLVMVSGGSADTSLSAQQDPAQTTYEIFDLFTGDWIHDPSSPSQNMLFPCSGGIAAPNPALAQYPRLHLLSNNRVFLSGAWQMSAYVVNAASPVNQLWTNGMWSISPHPPADGGSLQSASSVLVPNVGMVPGKYDEIMAIGGGNWTHKDVSDYSQRILGGSGPPVPTWGNQEQMVSPRMVGNAVLCPNGDIVMIGGSKDFYYGNPSPTPQFMTEVWDRTNGWVGDAAQASPRMYHSTAALLPSGRMVSAGSDVRTFDWEVYEPRYMHNGQSPPVFAGTWASAGRIALNWGTSYAIDYTSSSSAVARAVLMRACSTTHHSDMDQRYVELTTVQVTATRVSVTLPAGPTSGSAPNSVRALPGYYLLFLVSQTGGVSTGKWVYLP